MPTPTLSANKLISLALLLPVSAWTIHLFVSYTLAEWLCSDLPDGSVLSARENFSFLGISVMTIVICSSGLACAYKGFQRLRPVPAQLAFLLLAGAILNGYIIITILVQSLPVILVPIC